MSGLPNQLIAFGDKTNGRDKFCRFLQYSARLLSDTFLRIDENGYKDAVKMFKKLDGNISTARKLLRLGKSLEMIYSAKQALHIKDLILQSCVVISRLASAFFLFLDHIIWLHRVKLLKRDIQPVVQLSNRFWLLSISCGLVRNLYDWCRIYDHRKQLQSSRNARSEEFVPPLVPTLLDTVKNSFDVLIPLHGLKYLRVPGVVQGSTGAVSSVISMATVWNDRLKLINK